MHYDQPEGGDVHRIEIDLKNLKEESKMGEAVNVFTPADGGGGMAAAIPAIMAAGMGNRGDGFGGAGLGAGLIGGLIGGVLFGGGLGGFGRRDGGDCNRDAAPLNGTDGMAIMGAIGSVKDTIGASTMGLTNALMEGFAMQSTNTLQQTIMLGNIASSNQLMTTQGLNLINQNVSDQGCRTREAVANDGTATRALIVQLNTDNLNRLLTVADLDRRDERTFARSREVEVNVTQTVNQVQAQAQQQQQQQQITGLLTHLCGIVGNLQNAVATNSNLIVGNTGAVATGPQTANPVNVKG